MKPYGMGMPIPIFLSPKPSGVSQFVRGIYLASTRAESPLVQAADAIVLDATQGGERGLYKTTCVNCRLIVYNYRVFTQQDAALSIAIRSRLKAIKLG